MNKIIDKNVFVYIFLVMTIFYVMTAGGHLYTTDGKVCYRLTGSIALKRTFSVELDKYEIEEWGELTTIAGPDGKRYPKSSMGQSLACLPFYYTGMLFSVMTGRELTVFFVSFFNQVIAALICAVMFLFLRRLGYRRKTSLFTVFVLGMCTMLFPYARYFLNMPLASLFLLLSFLMLHPVPDIDPGSWKIVAAGSFYSLSLLTRPDMFVFYPCFILYLFWTRKQSRFKYILLFSLPLLFVLPVSLWYNLLRTGKLFSLGYKPDETFSGSVWPGIKGFIVNYKRSIFLYSPPLILSFFMFPKFLRKHKPEGIFIIGAFLLSLFLYSSWYDWEGGRSWGPRFLLPVIILAMIPLAEFFEKCSWNLLLRSVAYFIVGSGFFVQLTAIAVNHFRCFYALETGGAEFLSDPSSFMLSPVSVQLRFVKKFFDIYSWKGLDIWFLKGPVHRFYIFICLLFILFFFIIKLAKILNEDKALEE